VKHLIVLPTPWRELRPVSATIDVYREEDRAGFVMSIYFADRYQAHLRLPTPASFVDKRKAERAIADEIRRQAYEYIRDGTARGEARLQGFAQSVGPAVEAVRRMTGPKILLRPAQ
jgi:hypothetical protein